MTEFAKPQSSSGEDNHRQSSSATENHHVNGMSNGHSTNGSSSGVGGSGNGSATEVGGEKAHKSSSSSGHKSSHKSKDKDRHRDKDKDNHRSSSSHKSSSSSGHKSSHKDKSSSSSSSHRDKDKERSSSSSNHHKSSSSGDKHRSSSSTSGEKKDRDKDKDRSSHKSSSSSSKSSSSHHKSSTSSKDKPSSSSSSSHHHSSSSSKKRDHKDKERSRDKDKERRDRDRGDRKEERKLLNLPPPTPIANTNGHSSTDFNGSTDNASMDATSHHNSSSAGGANQQEMYQSDMYRPHVKIERMDISQASSCDYSLSQFRDDEQPFVAKAEPGSDPEEGWPNRTNSRRVEGDDDDEEEENDDEDVPLFKRKRIEVKKEKSSRVKKEAKDPLAMSDEDQMDGQRNNDAEEEEDNEDVPLTARKKIKTEKKTAKKEKKKKSKRAQESDYDDEEEEEEPKKKKVKKEKNANYSRQQQQVKVKDEESPTKGGGRKKKTDEEEEVWKWWEEEKREDGVKWNFLEHKGPVFAPDYEPVPKNVRFEYDGRTLELSQDAEEIATFYARMLDHDYTSKKVFNDNFFKDWRKSMTSKERELIKDLSKCNFRMMATYFAAQSEANKNRSKEEKLRLKEQNEAMVKEYGFCNIDGHKEKIGNFKIEPPGLFRGRGEHPKMGMVKRRVVAEDITLNCSKDSKAPKAPPGHRWKEVRHDNTVTWLASWTENVQGQVKYIMLNPSSRLKGEKDWAKYETARRLDKVIDKIRSTYKDEWKSKEMRIRQRAVALYFIDKLALRAGNEKDEDQADTVGCCSLRVEHIELHRELNGKENVVVFDFLGKDSIRYYNEVEVEKRVFKNLELFRENKKPGDDLFDRLNTVVMNEHLRELMDGLTAKVFRTYNASITLQRQLDELTEPNATVAEKLLQYNRANRAVAILCNHQRAVPKTHGKSMENLKEKIRTKRSQVDDCQVEFKDLQKAAKRGSTKEKLLADKKKKQLERLKEQLQKLEIQETDKDENKTIALGTSKLNYLDPRISVAWCKKFGVPIEKIFNKTQRDKFRWAIDMAGPDYRF